MPNHPPAPLQPSPPSANSLHRLADDSLARGGSAGRELLPQEHRHAFEAVTLAFEHFHAGRDAEARQALEAIGLGSPFLAWKLLLRGLIAYANRDDGRAIENWSRLPPERLPARLAAPLRALIDPQFLTGQRPEAQARIRESLDHLCGDTAQRLREVHRMLNQKGSIAMALRKTGPAARQLQAVAPDLLPALGQGFLNAIISHGGPEDLDRFAKVFDPPQLDPNLQRTEAIAFELRGLIREANRAWKLYAEWVQKSSLFLAKDRPRAAAIVWARMGRNGLDAQQPILLLDSPDVCFRKAIELAPDLLEAHDGLVKFYQSRNKPQQMQEAATALLERFPDHVPSLVLLARHCEATEDIAGARDYLRRAVALKPLDRKLRSQLVGIHRAGARAARTPAAIWAEIDAAIRLMDGVPTIGLLAQRWAVEMRIRDDQAAAATQQQLFASTPHRLAALTALVAEGARYRLPKAIRSEIEAEFRALLAEPHPDAVAAMIEVWLSDSGGGGFQGLMILERKIIAVAKTILGGIDCTSSQASAICRPFAQARLWKPLADLSREAQRQSFEGPWFSLWWIHAKLMLGKMSSADDRRVKRLLADLDDMVLDEEASALREELVELARNRNEMMFDALFDRFFSADDIPF